MGDGTTCQFVCNGQSPLVSREKKTLFHGAGKSYVPFGVLRLPYQKEWRERGSIKKGVVEPIHTCECTQW